MALGGYKFKGYHYTVPTDYDSTDTEQVEAQCLEMFRCRLKAFVDSCALSGAEWEFSYTDGAFSFGDYGNVIYKLDVYGYNHGAFFKYHGKEQYMMLYGAQGQYSGTGVTNYYSYYKSNATTYVDLGRYKSACGVVPITPTNWNVEQDGKLRLRSMEGSASFSTYSPSIANALFGFATKGCDVIEFERYTDSTLRYKVMSPDGFISLGSPYDQYPCFDIAYRSITFISSTGYASMPLTKFCQTLKGSGAQLMQAGEVYSSTGIIYPEHDAAFLNANAYIPYVSPAITSFVENNTISADYRVNSDGILLKGRVKPELLAINTPCPGSTMGTMTYYTPYCNGNYLLIMLMWHTSGTGSAIPDNGSDFANCALYCGWDPSNPDITQSSAWDEYTPEA